MNMRTPCGFLRALVALALAMPSAFAANYCWDTDGTTPGLGNSTGTWGTSTFFSTQTLASGQSAVVAGTSATNSVTTGTSDSILFGTDGMPLTGSANTIGISGTVTINNITFGSLADGPGIVQLGFEPEGQRP